MQKLKRNLISSYNIDDPNWGQNAMTDIDKFWAKLPPSESEIDPQRLGSKAVLISDLRREIMRLKVPPFVYEGPQPEFNALTTPEQYKFQLQSRKSGDNAWVHDLEVLPENLLVLSMASGEKLKLKQQRYKIDTDKLNEPPIVVDGDKLIQSVLPHLADEKPMPLIAALLLATGRRTIEILKTANFSLDDNMSPDGYECVFDGQAKQGLTPTPPYTIPLLAPYWLVKEALDKVRAKIDADKFTADKLHQKYANAIGKATMKFAATNPHDLRAIYAVMCYSMNTTKASMIGYIAGILGHTNPNNAMYYQRVIVQNFTGPYKAQRTVTAPAPAPAPATTSAAPTWVSHSTPEQKRIEKIQDLMLRKIKITPTAVRTLTGGSTVVIKRVLENNQALIDAYNATL
jgi:hypothetical protein